MNTPAAPPVRLEMKTSPLPSILVGSETWKAGMLVVDVIGLLLSRRLPETRAVRRDGSRAAEAWDSAATRAWSGLGTGRCTSRSVLARDGQQFRYQVPLQRAQILEEDTEYLLRSEIKAVDSPY